LTALEASPVVCLDAIRKLEGALYVLRLSKNVT
jgi:hypothetical protein